MTRAFLPLLHQSDDARIVNLSSIFGIIAPPGNTAYSASQIRSAWFFRIACAMSFGKPASG